MGDKSFDQMIQRLHHAIASACNVPVKYLYGSILVDGLTYAECLDHYISNQRHADDRGTNGYVRLTPCQLAVARRAWSDGLLSKVLATQDKERVHKRNQVTCQSQYDIDDYLD